MRLHLKRGCKALLLGVLFSSTPAIGYAHSPVSIEPAAPSNYPDGPQQTDPQSAPPRSAASASISGVVVDGNGADLQGARITLTSRSDAIGQTTESDSRGRFRFEDLVPGTFEIDVTFAGMEHFVSSEYIVHAGEPYIMPQVSLRVHADIDTQVIASPAEIAHEQLRTLEKQRVLTIFPNFYTSYFSHPAALSARQKYDLALHAVADPGTFLSAGAVAGIEQAENVFPGYGQGARGYAKRFGAAIADSAVSRMLGSAVLPGLLHQDPRYFYKGTGTARSRIIYALKMTVVCKADDGRYEPNYSHVVGSFASGGISNLYHAPVDRGLGLTMVQSLLDLTGRASNNLIQEFLLGRASTNVPSQTKSHVRRQTARQKD